MKQFTTLLWKEWRQLRGVRWSGVLLGAVLLLILLASTRFGSEGHASLLGYRTPSLEEIALDTAPLVFAAFLWPLVCLLTVVQAFTGDRSTRCEEFLLLLPVSRVKTWFARLFAASASYVVTSFVSGLLLALPVLLVNTEGRWARVGETLADPTQMQAAVLPLALAGGTAAAAFGVSSFAALGLALTLGLFVGVSAMSLPGVLLFMPNFYSHQPLILGLFLAPGILMLLGSALWCTIRGEPAGHGAWKRALPLVLASLFVPPGMLLSISHPLAEWGESRSLNHRFTAPKAGHLTFEKGYGAFIVDTRTAERVAFLPPFVSVWTGGFRDDGERLVAIQEERLFGALPMGGSALTLYDGEGEAIRTLDRESLDCDPVSAGWVGDRLLVSCYDEPGFSGTKRLLALDGEGRLKGTVADELEGHWAPAGRDIHGRDLLCLREWKGRERWHTTLVALDPETDQLQEELVAEASYSLGTYCDQRLSPDGRYFLSGDGELTDLLDGSLVPIPSPDVEEESVRSKLVAGGRVLRHWSFRDEVKVNELELVDIDERSSVIVRRWREGDWVNWHLSPDRTQALISVRRVIGDEENKEWDRAETWLLDIESAELSAVPVPAMSWAGPGVLAVDDGERLGLWRIGDPAEAVKHLH